MGDVTASSARAETSEISSEIADGAVHVHVSTSNRGDPDSEALLARILELQRQRDEGVWDKVAKDNFNETLREELQKQRNTLESAYAAKIERLRTKLAESRKAAGYSTEESTDDEADSRPRNHIAEGAIAGMIAGSLLGPAGAAVGAAIGARAAASTEGGGQQWAATTAEITERTKPIKSFLNSALGALKDFAKEAAAAANSEGEAGYPYTGDAGPILAENIDSAWVCVPETPPEATPAPTPEEVLEAREKAVTAREEAAVASEQRTRRLLQEAEKQVKQWHARTVVADAASAVALEAEKAAAVLRERVDQLERAVCKAKAVHSELKEEIEKLSEEARQSNARAAAAEARARQLQTQMEAERASAAAAAAAEYAEMEARLAASNSELAAAKVEMGVLTRRLRSQSAKLAELMGGSGGADFK